MGPLQSKRASTLNRGGRVGGPRRRRRDPSRTLGIATTLLLATWPTQRKSPLRPRPRPRPRRTTADRRVRLATTRLTSACSAARSALQER